MALSILYITPSGETREMFGYDTEGKARQMAHGLVADGCTNVVLRCTTTEGNLTVTHWTEPFGETEDDKIATLEDEIATLKTALESARIALELAELNHRDAESFGWTDRDDTAWSLVWQAASEIEHLRLSA